MNTSILERITEAEVVEWVEARRLQLSKRVPVSSIYLGVSGGRVHWSFHGAGECVVDQRDTESAVNALASEIYGDPQAKIEEKRQQAAQLLAEAQELETATSQPQ